jgi:hypothetical protein
MKKILSFLFAGALIFAFACTGGQKQSGRCRRNRLKNRLQQAGIMN